MLAPPLSYLGISILYPLRMTVLMYVGCFGLSSIFCRSRQMVFSAELVPYSYSSPQAAA